LKAEEINKALFKIKNKATEIYRIPMEVYASSYIQAKVKVEVGMSITKNMESRHDAARLEEQHNCTYIIQKRRQRESNEL